MQEVLEQALGRIAGTEVRVACAGRTDTGVHATRQLVSFHPPVRRPLRAWLLGGNSHLPEDVSLAWAAEVPDHFHARHSALARRYLYLLHNRRQPSALLAGRALHVPGRLNLEDMQKAAEALCGERDFSTFRAAHCQSRSPFRRVHFARVERAGEFVFLDIQANAFLLRMVRNIVGLLMEIGAGRRPPTEMAELLRQRDRRLLGKTAPAAGLYLIQVRYPDAFALPDTGPVWPPPLAALMAELPARSRPCIEPD